MAILMDLSGPAWQDVLEKAMAAAVGVAELAGEPDPLVAGVAQHLTAGVRAIFLATSGASGVAVRYSLVADRALVIAQPIVDRDGEIQLIGEARLAFAAPGESWETIAGLLPPFEVLVAPSTKADPSFSGEQVAAQDSRWAREQANLQMRVEAWPTPERAARVWGHWWSVVDDRLYDLRRREDELVGVERPAGAVAAEFAWALVGAMDLLAAAASAEADPQR
jgi:hypothetical protein